MTPLVLPQKNEGCNIAVPCGKCPECIARRTSAWSFRLMKEEERSVSSFFITLTYDTSTIHITKNGYMGLNKRDLQLFFKRLRKAHEAKWTRTKQGENKKPPIKYFAVGEYGGNTKRPHFHAIIFNAELELIQPAWKHGHIHYGDVNGASIGYCLKYMMKPSKIPMHRNDDRLPEFALMSKKLGDNYLTDAMRAWHEADMLNRMYIQLKGGQKVSMPRYYKDKIYTKEQRQHIGAHQQLKLADKLEKDMLSDPLFFKNEIERKVAAFEKMNRAAVQGRDKI